MKKIFLSLLVILSTTSAFAESKKVDMNCVLFARDGKTLQTKKVTKTINMDDYVVDTIGAVNEVFYGYKFEIVGADEGLILLSIENVKTKASSATFMNVNTSTNAYDVGGEGTHFMTLLSKKKLDGDSGIYDIFGGDALIACDLERIP